MAFGKMARSKEDTPNFSGHELAEARKNLKAVLRPPKREEAVIDFIPHKEYSLFKEYLMGWEKEGLIK